MKKINKKISVAIANYNNEMYIETMLDCLLAQSYKNLEIIVVNDGSPGDCDSIMAKYNDDRIKYVKHEKNKGLFQARLTGAEHATGDYIAFLDADDYVSHDYFRSMIYEAEKSSSDIVIGNIVLKYDDGKEEYFNLFETNYNELNGEECLEEYFRQEGLNFSWHTGCNQLYSMKLWKKAEPHYKKITKRLLMTEDFAFSTVLFYYAKKVTKVDYECLFYCKHGITSTSINDINVKKETNNINDLITSFTFVENFLKEKKVYDKYEKNFNNWKLLYAGMHRGYIKNAKKISKTDKDSLEELMNNYCENTQEISNSGFFSSIVSKWDDRLDRLHAKIIDEKIKCVSFDIFDTLVVRPFLRPTDLFKFLDKEYRKEVNGGVEFSEMREVSEVIARNNQYEEDSSIQEITLDDIYNVIHDVYYIDNKILSRLKKVEEELEIKFCEQRKTAYNLYQLALNCGKKVICTSDMYLPLDVIKKILDKNGYNDIDKIYLSSEIKKTKSTGDLFDYVIKDLEISAKEIVHIGDNKLSDYKIPSKKGINAVHFYKATDVFLDRSLTNGLGQIFNTSLPFWQDNKESVQFMGIRTMIAVIANKYFDNPFRPFNKKTDFNADPYLIGYYALGMYVFGISNWLLKEVNGKNDKISFMARDGYLVMEAYDRLSKLYLEAPKSEYMYVSRKALIPVMIQSELDFYRLSEIVDYRKHSPKSLIKYLKSVLKLDDKLEEKCNKSGIEFERKFKSLLEFNRFIKFLIDNYFDKKSHIETSKKYKEYFDSILGKNPAVFDVGYSGRPEYYLTRLCGKSIDTYFLNINGDRALTYSNIGDFEVKTFFNYKPTATGNAYELLISKLSPSCIGYDISGDNVKPIFEDYKFKYQVDYVVETMQKAALEFVDDMIHIFGEDISLLHYQDCYVSMPMLAYYNSARRLDKAVLEAVEFEDDIKSSGSRKMIDDMQEDLDSKNQIPLPNMISGIIGFDSGPVKVGDLYYNPFVDLNNKSKIRRILYFLLYDRETLKRRIRDSISKLRKK
ncbi:MAG TPA: hypothetical protein DCE23_00190 [Firmicutes bacterium]|nr:hypothetical protein [Bacillota bacterium]